MLSPAFNIFFSVKGKIKPKLQQLYEDHRYFIPKNRQHYRKIKYPDKFTKQKRLAFVRIFLFSSAGSRNAYFPTSLFSANIFFMNSKSSLAYSYLSSSLITDISGFSSLSHFLMMSYLIIPSPSLHGVCLPSP